eukprot:6830354-Pyramimonas_sp.AAC.1
MDPRLFVPRPVRDEGPKYVVHFGRGEVSRELFQGLAESFLTNEQGRVYVLRVDLQSEDCAMKSNGDIRWEPQFVDFVRRGKVLAVLARPPDDTWRPPARDGGTSTQRLRD